MTRIRPRDLRLYLVLDPDVAAGDPLELASDVLDHGVTCLQLRWKSAPDKDVVHLARQLVSLCKDRCIPFIVNNRLDIALAVGAHGVHLGVEDLELSDARTIAPHDFAIGYSPDSDEDLRTALVRGATYLGIGPIFGTTTKADAGAALGTAEFSRRRKLTGLPVVAIGGISADNAFDAIQAGADGVAVVSAIVGAPDPIQATRRISASLYREP